MTTSGREIVRLELKYCEECGGLWLRIENTSGSYCASCEQRLDKLPDRAEDNRLRGGTGPMRRAAKSPGRRGYLDCRRWGRTRRGPHEQRRKHRRHKTNER